MMSTSDFLVLAGWGVMCHVWSVLLWMQRRIRRDGTLLSPELADDAAQDADVCVVIPARNEAAGIEACLHSALTQDLRQLRVVVADDRSDDGTSAVVRRVAASDPRVRLVVVDRLPDGWLGKTHALVSATEEITADWLLFLDADCRLLAPTAVRVAVHEAIRRRVDMLTLLPSLTTGSFGEGLLIPLCSAVMALWYGRSNRVKAAGFANGQFLLVRRAAYEAVGGHASVRHAVIEDVPLAEVFRSAGFTTWAGGGAALVSVRMYDGLRSSFKGWSRIFVGALRSPSKLLLSVAWLIAGSLWPFLALPWLVGVAWIGETVPAAWWALFTTCVAHLTLLMAVSIGFWGLGRCDRRYLWLYPASVLGVIAILLHAVFTLTVTGTVGWRDTAYRIDRSGRLVPGPTLQELR